MEEFEKAIRQQNLNREKHLFDQLNQGVNNGINTFEPIISHQTVAKQGQESGSLAKSIITDDMTKALNKLDELSKGGKKAFIGEIRTFAGREHIKTADGWKFHGKGTGKKAQEHKASSQTQEKKEEKHPSGISIKSVKDTLEQAGISLGDGSASVSVYRAPNGQTVLHPTNSHSTEKLTKILTDKGFKVEAKKWTDVGGNYSGVGKDPETLIVTKSEKAFTNNMKSAKETREAKKQQQKAGKTVTDAVNSYPKTKTFKELGLVDTDKKSKHTSRKK